jgi:hypothetical protein
MAIVGTRVGSSVLPSHSCGLWDLVDDSFTATDADRSGLLMGQGWARRWTVTRKTVEGPRTCPVAELDQASLAGCLPVRRFSWRTGQRHRPGLQFMASTGGHQGFESIAEQRLLLVLDFAGAVRRVWSQPFRLRFSTGGGWWEHIPDFLVHGRDGMVVVDVRPAGRVGADDRVRFAAAAEAALACGWRYLVAAGWRRHVMSTLDTLSAQRRSLGDPLGVQTELLALAGTGPAPFGALTAATSVPALARAHALHLLWHRRLSIDLTAPLSDRTAVSVGAR